MFYGMSTVYISYFHVDICCGTGSIGLTMAKVVLTVQLLEIR